MKTTPQRFFTLWFATLCLAPTASAAITEYSSGHGDIGLAFHDGELELHYHFGDGAILNGSPLAGEIEFEPGEAYVRVSNDALRSATAPAPQLGLATGDPVWLLPQNEVSGLPFLGIASEELAGLGFSSATLSLTSFSGPALGQFALWQPDGFGGTDVLWQTNNGFDGTDLLNMNIGGHAHFFYGFTQQGVYDLELTAVANLTGGGSLTDVGTFRFVVGSATAVPEPGSMVALGVITVGAVVVRRRRKNAAKQA